MFSNQGRIYSPQPTSPVQPAYPSQPMQPGMGPMSKGPPVMRPMGMQQPQMQGLGPQNPMGQPGIMGLLRGMGGDMMGRTPGY